MNDVLNPIDFFIDQGSSIGGPWGDCLSQVSMKEDCSLRANNHVFKNTKYFATHKL